MSASAPPRAALAAIEDGTSQITRRLEIYEADGTTRWYPEGIGTEATPRMVEGSVSINYGSDERRTIDVTLLNDDNLLRPESNRFWYDKVIKVFRGVRYASDPLPPRIAIVEAPNEAFGWGLRTTLTNMGFTRTDMLWTVTDANAVAGYDIVVSYKITAASAKGAMLKSLYDSGVNVLTIGAGNDLSVLPFATSGAAVTAGTWGISKPPGDSLFGNGSWTTETQAGTHDGYKIYTVSRTAKVVATQGGVAGPHGEAWSDAQPWVDAEPWGGVDGSGGFITGIAAESDSGARWFDLHLPDYKGSSTLALLKQGMNWLRNYREYLEWEVQVGEFMVDAISMQNFPKTVSVTGRDYSKRCMNSKFADDTSFGAGVRLGDLVRSLATTAGITKFKFAANTPALDAQVDAARGTPRWEIMQEACEALGYELFFDNEGYLVLREFLDPTFSPVSAIFKTGPQGNLVSIERSVNDSEIYNHVVVISTNSDDSETLPYFGEAKNTEPSSPTNIARLGDRMKDPIESSLVTSNAQAREMALKELALSALESYELSFDSINYPWLEAGEVAAVYDPDAVTVEPVRYFMDSISIPLGLGPMSITGRRVTLVGDPGNTVVIDSDGNVVSVGSDVSDAEAAAALGTGPSGLSGATTTAPAVSDGSPYYRARFRT